MTLALTLVGLGGMPQAEAAVIGDDYPANLKAAAKDALVDPWLFYNRECTSFAAWRLNSTNAIPFTNYYWGVHWGNANNWGPAARAIGIRVDGSPGVGSIAWSSRGDGHVAWVAEVGQGTVTIEEYNQNFLGNYGLRTVATSTFDGYIHLADLSTTIGDGSTIAYRGDVYQIVGGAPVYVSSWDAIGGPKSTIAVGDDQFAHLAQYPRDGSLLNVKSGAVYRIVGGAPIYVSSWDAIGGPQPTTVVDQYSLDHADEGGVLNHLHKQPADGSMLNVKSGEVYRIVGGAPIYVSSWDAIGGPQPTTVVDQYSLNHAGEGNIFNHLRFVPANGTVLNGTDPAHSFVVTDGIATPRTRRAGTTIDQAALDHAGMPAPWNHLNTSTPAAKLKKPPSKTSSSRVKLNWTPVISASATSGYDLRWQLKGRRWTAPRAWTGVGEGPVTKASMRSGKTYCFAILAHNLAGKTGPWSSRRCTKVKK